MRAVWRRFLTPAYRMIIFRVGSCNASQYSRRSQTPHGFLIQHRVPRNGEVKAKTFGAPFTECPVMFGKPSMFGGHGRSDILSRDSYGFSFKSSSSVATRDAF